MDMGVPGGDVGSEIGKRAQRFFLRWGGSAEAFVVAFAHLAEWPPQASSIAAMAVSSAPGTVRPTSRLSWIGKLGIC